MMMIIMIYNHNDDDDDDDDDNGDDNIGDDYDDCKQGRALRHLSYNDADFS
jgi:hypothetical protein